MHIDKDIDLMQEIDTAMERRAPISPNASEGAKIAVKYGTLRAALANAIENMESKEAEILIRFIGINKY